jgi:hypothetical protein
MRVTVPQAEFVHPLLVFVTVTQYVPVVETAIDCEVKTGVVFQPYVSPVLVDVAVSVAVALAQVRLSLFTETGGRSVSTLTVKQLEEVQLFLALVTVTQYDPPAETVMEGVACVGAVFQLYDSPESCGSAVSVTVR